MVEEPAIPDYDSTCPPLISSNMSFSRSNSVFSGGNQLSKIAPAIEFVRFPKLPLELRVAIWKVMAQQGRVITVRRKGHPLIYTTVPKHNAAAVPSILHTSKEARCIGLETYRAYFGTRFSGHPIYFNFDIDALYFPSYDDMRAFYGGLVASTTIWPPDILQIEQKPKKLIVGGKLLDIHNGLTARFEMVEEVAIEEPADIPPHERPEDLVDLKNLWQCLIGKDPGIRFASKMELKALEDSETVSCTDTSGLSCQS
jgi:2EXR family